MKFSKLFNIIKLELESVRRFYKSYFLFYHFKLRNFSFNKNMNKCQKIQKVKRFSFKKDSINFLDLQSKSKLN